RVGGVAEDGGGGTGTTSTPEVDPITRNARMRATVENPDGRLNPGMFASVEVKAGNVGQALVVPATAVIYAPFGDSVYLVEEKKDDPDKAEPGKTPPPAAPKPADGQPVLAARHTVIGPGPRRSQA